MKKLILLLFLSILFSLSSLAQDSSPKLSFSISSGVPIITPGLSWYKAMVNNGLNQSITHDFYFFETTSFYPRRSTSLPLEIGIIYLRPHSGALGVEFSILNGEVKGHKGSSYLTIEHKNYRINPFYRFLTPDGNAYFQTGLSLNLAETTQKVTASGYNDHLFLETTRKLRPGLDFGIGAKLLSYSELPSPGANFLSKLTQGLNVGLNIDYNITPFPQAIGSIYANHPTGYQAMLLRETKLIYMEFKVGLTFDYVVRLKDK